MATMDGVVYMCSSEAFQNVWCGASDYAPGDGLYWEQVWSVVGSCDLTATISPTHAPVYEVLENAGGCPDEFESGLDYEEGDKVTVDKVVYVCKPWPLSAYCKMEGFEPGNSNGKEAWGLLGFCDGKW